MLLCRCINGRSADLTSRGFTTGHRSIVLGPREICHSSYCTILAWCCRKSELYRLPSMSHHRHSSPSMPLPLLPQSQITMDPACGPTSVQVNCHHLPCTMMLFSTKCLVLCHRNSPEPDGHDQPVASCVVCRGTICCCRICLPRLVVTGDQLHESTRSIQQCF